VLVGRAAICLGPVHMYLGILAAALGREAEPHFDAAADWCDASGARAWAVWTAVHRAEARGEPDPAAHAAAEAIGFGRAAARAARLLSA
jgi:hypothetical protein